MLAALMLPLALRAQNDSEDQWLPDFGTQEVLTYDVMYKWGLINKKAGEATLMLNNSGDEIITRLTAKSEPWADHIYCVRDTLNGLMDATNWAPLLYEKIANEGSERKHDKVLYDYSTPGEVKAYCTRKVFKKNQLRIDDSRELVAEQEAIDMLSSFYYMRRLPFDTMTPGQKYTIAIFSGKQKELLTITYTGVETVSYDNRNVAAYHITFSFTSKGGTKSSDDMDTWIACDADRIPIKLEGKLPVGKVKCYLTSGYNAK